MSITRSDLLDIDFVDQLELGSDGTYVYLTLSVVSTTSGTKTVVVGTAGDGEGIQTGKDHPLEEGDRAVISGTSGGLGDGTFTVQSIVDDFTFIVADSIGTSTGGSCDFQYPPGASKVGFDPTGQTLTAATNVQQALFDLSNTALDSTRHAALRQLIHLADGVGGPFEAWASGSFRETLPLGSVFPTTIIWWTDNTKTTKILQKTVTFNGIHLPTSIKWSMYDVTGSTVIAEATDALTYTGTVFEASRTRTII